MKASIACGVVTGGSMSCATVILVRRVTAKVDAPIDLFIIQLLMHGNLCVSINSRSFTCWLAQCPGGIYKPVNPDRG